MLDTGTRLGPYEIVSQLGAGGMGEVYRARDTRLDRTVAIKVLPRAFASNANLKQRFEREARTISQLSHPNICTMHDFGQDEGVDYLVMEYLEGETLADRLAKGPLPVEKAIRHAIEIADALDKAHRQGIVHRDLKPGNVMLTRSGAKLLDFGLAKATPAVDGNAPTMQKSLTEEGTIVGTVQYMAPEQLEGAAADARTDIFAFGALLYEMLTGKRAFEGKTRTSVIAAIVERQPPPISQFQPLTPPSLERLVRHCLAKDPEERWQTAHDLLLELRALGESDSAAGVRRPVLERRRRREMLAWVLAAVFLAAALFAGYRAWRASTKPPEVLRAAIVPPRDTSFQFGGDNAAALTISPNGRYVTYVVRSGNTSRLWVRSLDQSEARPIAGTEAAMYPFWSPDSQHIGFFSNRKLKRVPVAGGAVVTITEDARDSRGGSWGRDDVIVYAHHWRSALYRISASGGKATQLTKLDEARRETTHRYPHFLPDGEHFLYLAGSHMAETTSGENAIYAASVRDGQPRRLVLHARSNVVYAAGHLLFYRDGQLMAQPFDLKQLALHGEARPVVSGVRYEKGFFRGVFDASADGKLVYQPGSPQTNSQLTWFDRTGKRMGTLGEPGDLYDVRISPDQKHVLVGIEDPSDLWLYEVARGVRTRLTFGNFGEQSAVFSPDGTSIVYSSDRSTLFDVFRRTLSGQAAEIPLLTERNLNEYPLDWNGSLILFEREDLAANTQSDLWVLPTDGRKPFPIVQTPAQDTAARISPDGKWIAYTSLESGQAEVYVTSFPKAGGKWQVSQGGGGVPCWRGDGQEIFFVQNSKIMAAAVKASGEMFTVGELVELFTVPIRDLPPPFYDVAADGNRFLINTMLEGTEPEPVVVVTNWPQILEQR